tara:strand:+ start:993 stop:1304 length:312 start_codon:yes stop_codon:yes gene_type:complete
MKTNKDIQSKVQETFEALDVFQEVKVSPFFKDKTMQRLFSEKEDKQLGWLWFTPKLQLATLICVIALNVFAFTKFNTSDYEEKVTDFASSYGLTIESNTTIFN